MGFSVGRRPYYDEVDKKALKLMTKERVNWTPQEDSLVLTLLNFIVYQTQSEQVCLSVEGPLPNYKIESQTAILPSWHKDKTIDRVLDIKTLPRCDSYLPQYKSILALFPTTQ